MERLAQYCAKALDKMPENFAGTADAWTILPSQQTAPRPFPDFSTSSGKSSRSQVKSDLMRTGLMYREVQNGRGESSRTNAKASSSHKIRRKVEPVRQYSAEQCRQVEERLRREGKL
jgi:hypothetical protein